MLLCPCTFHLVWCGSTRKQRWALQARSPGMTSSNGSGVPASWRSGLGNALCCKSSLFKELVHCPGPGLFQLLQFRQPLPHQPRWVHLMSSLSPFLGGPELKPLFLATLQ